MKRFLIACLIALSSFAFSFMPAASSTVWICVGGSAYAYHAKKSCRGLDNCTHTIKEVTQSEAESIYNRRACKVCH